MKSPQSPETLHTCAQCGRANFTAAGLRSHRCGPKPSTLAQSARDILLQHSPAAPAPAPKESLLAKIARERREARAASGAAAPPVMPRTKLKRRPVREVIVEVEKKPLLIPLKDLAFHPKLERITMLPVLLQRETKKGNESGRNRATHKANAEELDLEYQANVDSVATHGILNPLKVLKTAKGKWLIVDGRHRYEYAKAVASNRYADPAKEAHARSLEIVGLPCEEVKIDDVDTIILTALKHRNYSKGALAYLALLMRPEVATEAKAREKAGKAVEPCAFSAQGLATETGVSLRLMRYAITLYQIFKTHASMRPLYEPAIWVGGDLGRIIGGVNSRITTGVDPADAPESPEQTKLRQAGEYAVHALDRLTKLEVTLRNWEAMLPEGRASVIERTVAVLSDAPADLRQAILTGLQS